MKNPSTVSTKPIAARNKRESMKRESSRFKIEKKEEIKPEE